MDIEGYDGEDFDRFESSRDDDAVVSYPKMIRFGSGREFVPFVFRIVDFDEDGQPTTLEIVRPGCPIETVPGQKTHIIVAYVEQTGRRRDEYDEEEFERNTLQGERIMAKKKEAEDVAEDLTVERLPYVGQIVHYLDDKSPEHCAAIVAHVYPDQETLNLCIIQPTGHPHPLRGIPFCADADRGPSWHYVEEE